jgi:hypothetical protein
MLGGPGQKPERANRRDPGGPLGLSLAAGNGEKTQMTTESMETKPSLTAGQLLILAALALAHWAVFGAAVAFLVVAVGFYVVVIVSTGSSGPGDAVLLLVGAGIFGLQAALPGSVVGAVLGLFVVGRRWNRLLNSSGN